MDLRLDSHKVHPSVDVCYCSVFAADTCSSFWEDLQRFPRIVGTAVRPLQHIYIYIHILYIIYIYIYVCIYICMHIYIYIYIYIYAAIH